MNNIAKFFSEYEFIEKAQSWDNTGIIIANNESNMKETKIMLANDITKLVIEEAIQLTCTHIISYHPLIFHKLKSISDPVIIKIIQNNIGVYSPHTSLDLIMCKKMAKLIGSLIIIKSESTFIKCMPNERNPKSLSEYLAILSSNVFVKDNCDKKRILRYNRSECLNDEDLTKIYPFNIIIGMGAANPQFKDELIPNDDMNTPNLIITGEMSHHDLLYYTKNNTRVIMMEHSNSERFFLDYLQEDMKNSPHMTGIEIVVSKNDFDPVKFYTYS